MPMASAAVLQLLLISLVVFGAVTWSATATIVPCKPPSNIPIVKGDKIGKCGFLIPNNTIQQQLRFVLIAPIVDTIDFSITIECIDRTKLNLYHTYGSKVTIR